MRVPRGGYEQLMANRLLVASFVIFASLCIGKSKWDNAGFMFGIATLNILVLLVVLADTRENR